MPETEEAGHWPVGGGETGERIRTFPWPRTPLGALERWPISLRTAVDICLVSPVPTAVLWGPEFVQIPNDAYAETVSGGPPDSLLGRPFLQNYPEIHGLLGEILSGVWSGGSPASLEYPPTTFAGSGTGGVGGRFTFYFSAIRGENGEVAGIFHHAAEAADPRTDPDGRYRTLLYSFGDAVLVGEVIPDGKGRAIDFRYREVNGAYEAMTGLRAEQLIGKTARDVLPGLDSAWILGFGRAGLQEKTVRIEDYNTTLSKWLSIRFTPVGERGSGLVAAIFTDITLRKRADATLLEAAAHTAFRVALTDALRPLTDAAEIQTVAARIVGEHLGASRVHYAEFEDDGRHANVLRDYARDGANAPGRFYLHAFEIFMRECRAGRTLVIEDVATDGRFDETERGLFGSLAIVSIVAVPLLKADKLLAIFAVHRDIPHEWTPEEIALVEETAERALGALDRARAERALRRSEEKFRALTMASSDALYQMSADWSAMWQLSSGRSLTDNDQRNFSWLQDYIHPDDQEFVLAAIDRAIREKSVFELEHRVRTDDGTLGWTFSRAIPLLDSDGEITEWFGTASDITARKQAEIALRESEERFRLLVEGARDYAMFLLDSTGQITFWSTGAERVFGWIANEANGRAAEFLFIPEDRQRGVPERQMAMARETGRVLQRHWAMRRDGTRFWADGILMRLTNADGSVRGFAKVARDATEQKQAEEATQAALDAVERANQTLEQRVSERTEELVHLNRMHQELLRKLVNAQEQERARISRDLHDDTGQHMTALILGLSYLKNSEYLAAKDEAQELLTRLERHAGEVAKKAHQLAFTLRPTSLDDIGLMGSLQNYVDEWCIWSGIKVDLQGVGLEDDEDAPTPRLSPEIETTIYRVAQEALTNILRHAIIAVSGSKREAHRVSIVVQRAARNVVTTIEDDGPGFDVERVMKSTPGNRHLGIFGMQERARLVGGTLTIESERGKGTTVFLRLPLFPSPVSDR